MHWPQSNNADFTYACRQSGDVLDGNQGLRVKRVLL
jgi:hypothetical protein